VARAIRVCVVAPSLDILGGQSVQADRLVRRLRELPGLSVETLAVNPRLPGPLRLLQRIKYVRTALTSIAYFSSLVARLGRYDVVHVFSASYLSYLIAPVPAMLVGRLYRKRVLLNYHSGHLRDHFRRWHTAAPLARLAHLIVVPSAYLAGEFREFGLEARIVPNFIDETAYRFRPRERFAPVFFANRSFESGYNVACVLRAFGRIQQAIPDARLMLAGAGSLEQSLRRLSEQLALRNVNWLGLVPPEQMPGLYAQCDFYLNAPNVDNMPLSVLEAQMSGVPVVTTNAGGIPLLVEDGETGRMVPCDDHEALAGAALDLLANPHRAQSIATNARRVCEQRYTWRAVGAQWMHEYTDLIRRRDAGNAAAPPARDVPASAARERLP
jgi:glycosyltransferase involved in cell wall biosynthesis